MCLGAANARSTAQPDRMGTCGVDRCKENHCALTWPNAVRTRCECSGRRRWPTRALRQPVTGSRSRPPGPQATQAESVRSSRLGHFRTLGDDIAQRSWKRRRGASGAKAGTNVRAFATTTTSGRRDGTHGRTSLPTLVVETPPSPDGSPPSRVPYWSPGRSTCRSAQRGQRRA